MITFLTIVHISTVVLLVIAVLLQSGKGAEISASFGGSSQTVFGSSGGANFFQKMTYGLAAVFMCTSLTLTILPSRIKKSVFEGYTPPAAEPAKPGTAPATPGTADAKGAAATSAPATGAPAATNTAATKATDAATTAKAPADAKAAAPAKAADAAARK